MSTCSIFLIVSSVVRAGMDLPAAVDSCGHLGPPHSQPPQCQQEGRQESSRGTELSKLKGAVAVDFSWPIFWPNQLGTITGFTFSEATLIFFGAVNSQDKRNDNIKV